MRYFVYILTYVSNLDDRWRKKLRLKMIRCIHFTLFFCCTNQTKTNGISKAKQLKLIMHEDCWPIYILYVVDRSCCSVLVCSFLLLLVEISKRNKILTLHSFSNHPLSYFFHFFVSFDFHFYDVYYTTYYIFISLIFFSPSHFFSW